jgi:hypothetical protein
MLGKKPEIKIDYDKTIEPEFLDFLERIESLDMQAARSNRFIDKQDLQWSTTMSELKRELNMITRELEQMDLRNKDMRRNFVNIVNDFKLRSMEDDFKRLQNSANTLRVEKLITRNEFKRMLRDSLE